MSLGAHTVALGRVGLVLDLWLLALVASGGAAAASLPVEEVAPGVFVHHGLHEDPTRANRGGIANLAFIVGDEAVAVVDTGGSLAQGRDLLAAIRARTDRPVRFVVNTHAHPDHVLGNGAFIDPATVFVGHARQAAALAERGPHYLAAMRAVAGAALEGTILIEPTATVGVDRELVLDLGGRTLTVRGWPTAHTDCDVTAFDSASHILFAGDLVFMERLPVVDGSLNGWLKVMAELASIPARAVVPGHGPVLAPWPGALAPQRGYLEELRASVREALARRLSLAATVEAVAPPPAAAWRLRESNHERNVTASYAELEWE